MDQKYKTSRINILSIIAYITVIFCILVTVFATNLNEYAKGIITFVLGRFSGYTDQIYNFEFGTSRTNKEKDQTINNLTNESKGK